MTSERAACAEIDLSAIEHNVRSLDALTPAGTLFMAVVKAEGYGHGAVESAHAALRAGADRLGVATVGEATCLREAGISVPLQVLSEPPLESVETLIEHDIIPAVTTRAFAAALGRAASAHGVEVRYHLKIDTGMNRIGVRAEDAPGFAAGLAEFPGLLMEGLFTHFATADVPGDWGFESQIERFTQAIERIRDEGVDPGIVHSCNSAATILHPEAHMGMVRCGIAIYGLHPSQATRELVDLRPAMRVTGRIVLVKRVAMGEGVSYGLIWRAAAPTVIATLPLGYADGVHRVLSGSMYVLIDGRRCKQVGRICMDQLMVEVPRTVAAAEGDEAVIVGSQGEETILLDELAELAGTINYEMACAFGMRLPREYV